MQRFMISVSECSSVCVCLFVCLSACLSQKPQSKFHQIFYMLPMGVALSFCYDSEIRYVDIFIQSLCTSGFMDEVMFSYNAGNRAESKTTRMFHPVRQVAAPIGRQTTFFWSRSLCGGIRDEVCRLRLHLVIVLMPLLLLSK